MRTDLQKWLEDKCKCYSVQPCTVVVDRYVFEACRYTQMLVGGTEPREMIYCIGQCPAHRRKLVCYTLANDTREWYVAGYADPRQPIKPEHKEYNPFGHNFLLSPWTANGKIDDGERYVYQRIPLSVQFPVTPADTDVEAPEPFDGAAGDGPILSPAPAPTPTLKAMRPMKLRRDGRA